MKSTGTISAKGVWLLAISALAVVFTFLNPGQAVGTERPLAFNGFTFEGQLFGVQYQCGYPDGCEYKAAQSFQFSSTESISSIDFLLKTHEEYPGPTDIVVTIEQDADGVPSGIAIADAMIPGFYDEHYGWHRAVFSPQPVVDPNTTYWIVLDYSGGTGDRGYRWAMSYLGLYRNGQGRWWDEETLQWDALQPPNTTPRADYIFVIW